MFVNRLRAGSALLGLILIATLLSGCGKKGPLYLPKEDVPPVPAPSTETQIKDLDTNKNKDKPPR